ncbi:transcription negative regulator ChrR [Phragmitibacter flavus]|uniref:Transcription negative regulator ChrR n=1 Tax=Phragmitibacter flavus TaxID=2576071 RepID=A0A5R8KCG0_9BACT|nr:cupin domain-containing protein [Phragmitibacter flavus]TLD69990.1 transcription negative regulator ChrR [Phragmitibacter flavus]
MIDDQNLQTVQILRDLVHVDQWQNTLPWQPFQEGVEIHRLYGDGQNGPCAALLKFRPGGKVPRHEHTGFEHIFILSGTQTDDQAKSEAGTLIINPPGTSHAIISESGCIVLAIYERPVKFI